MKITYDPFTDSLYIELSAGVAADSRPLADGVVADFDRSGKLLGLDVEHAGIKVDLDRFVSEGLPAHPARVA